MSLLGWVVGAAILDEWGRREEGESLSDKRSGDRFSVLVCQRHAARVTRGRDVPAPFGSVRPWEQKGRC